MKILLIIPPYLINRQEIGIRPDKAMLPVGILSIASGLRSLGAEVKALDLVFARNWQYRVAALRGQFDLVLISCHTARNIPAVKAVIDSLPKRYGKSRIILGGNLCAQFGVAEFRQLGIRINAVCRGYGHGALEDLFAADGDIWPKSVTELMPLPDLSLLSEDVSQKYLLASRGQYPIVAGSFGCKYRCAYCQAHQNTRLAVREFGSVVDEVRQAVSAGYRKFWAVDNLCFANITQTIRFDQLLADLGTTWSGMCRPEDAASPGNSLLQRFKALREIAVGIESTSRPVLDKQNRSCTRSYGKQIRLAFKNLRRAKVSSTAFVILDAPASSESDFWQLRRFLHSVRPDNVSWAFFNPSPKEILAGTRMPREFGFYGWPLGCSPVDAQRIVQQAMILSGEYWGGYQLEEDVPFWEDADCFGVNFQGTNVYQRKTARSARGDLWAVWKEESR